MIQDRNIRGQPFKPICPPRSDVGHTGEIAPGNGREQNTLRLIAWGALGFTGGFLIMVKCQITIEVYFDIAKAITAVAIFIYILLL